MLMVNYIETANYSLNIFFSVNGNKNRGNAVIYEVHFVGFILKIYYAPLLQK